MNLDAETIVGGLKVAGSSIAAGAVLWKWPVGPVVRWMRTAATNLSLVPVMAMRIDEVAAEFRTNGGSTVKDDLLWTRNELGRQSVMLEANAREVGELKQVQWQLMNDARRGIFQADAAGHVIHVNQTLCRITGRSADELRGNRWVIAVSDGSRDRMLKDWNDAVRFARDFDQAVEFLHTDGRRFIATVTARVMLDDDDAVIGWIGSVSKIPGTEAPAGSPNESKA